MSIEERLLSGSKTVLSRAHDKLLELSPYIQSFLDTVEQRKPDPLYDFLWTLSTAAGLLTGCAITGYEIHNFFREANLYGQSSISGKVLVYPMVGLAIPTAMVMVGEVLHYYTDIKEKTIDELFENGQMLEDKSKTYAA